MTIDTKLELLRYKLLNGRFGFDVEIYDLLNWGDLWNEIERIDEKSFYFWVEPVGNEITAYNFLLYMNEFIKYMKHYFFNINAFQNILSTIVKENKQELNYLLDYKYEGISTTIGFIEDNELKERIYKIIIGNFIKNAKYIPAIEKILNEHEIILKDVKDYNLEESESIIKLLSDIVFSQRGHGFPRELFENIDIHINQYLEKKSRHKGKKTKEEHKQYCINLYIKNYETIFKSYNTRKKYLKYFI